MLYNANYSCANPNFQGVNIKDCMGWMNKMTLSGKGLIRVKPDTATINLGIETTGNNLSNVQAENAALSSHMINALLNLGIREKDIQTYSYTINPEYDYIDGKQVFRGYKVTNNFKVTVNDVNRIGNVIDAAVKSGANLAQNIEFGLSNPIIYYNQALNLAIEDAIKKAENIERRFNYAINMTPISIKEESMSQPVIMESAAFKVVASTPVQGGLLEITASITAEFCYR